MATYAIGDVQGCFDELQALLRRIGFNPVHDRLWFVGDLVNRGPKSLEVLRFVRELADRAVVVLGNHDLHLITQYEGFERKRKDDTFDDVLGAPDAKAASGHGRSHTSGAASTWSTAFGTSAPASYPDGANSTSECGQLPGSASQRAVASRSHTVSIASPVCSPGSDVVGCRHHGQVSASASAT